MASNNNDSGAGAGIALFLAVIGATAIMFAVFLAFLAFVFTFIAILAWNNPLRLGKLIVTPKEARDFVGRGILGAIGLPAFAAVCEVFLQVSINWDYLMHMMVGGYTLGSIGVEIMMADDGPHDLSVTIIPPEQQLPPSPRVSLPAPEPQPSRFASWDDE